MKVYIPMGRTWVLPGSVWPHIAMPLEIGSRSVSVESHLVTIHEFTAWYKTVTFPLLADSRRRDAHYWESTTHSDPDRPVVGVTLAEATAYAWCHGGRLLYARELLRCVNGDTLTKAAAQPSEDETFTSWCGVVIHPSIPEWTTSQALALTADGIVVEKSGYHLASNLDVDLQFGMYPSFMMLGEHSEITPRWDHGFRVAYDEDQE
jgi:hypothetical protein